MSKNIPEIPYTEIKERLRDIARSGRNTMSKIGGAIQDVYLRETPSKFDWNFLMVSSSLETIAEYNDGTVTMNTGDTTVLGNGTIFDSSMTGRKIKFNSNEAVYDITGFTDTTSLTIAPALRGANNLSADGYTIFQPFYPVASDFDRFPKEGGIYKWSGGQKVILDEEHRFNWIDDYTSSPSIPESTRLMGADTTGTQLVEFNPPPSDARVYGYDYIRRLNPMIETTAGTLSSVNAQGTTVSGNTNTRFTEANTGDWFRVDNLGTGADSTWYRIASISNDSSLTLATVFANSAITSSANYTISRAPEIPHRLHIGILYGAIRYLELDQNDENFAFYHAQYAQVLTDSVRIYVSRPYTKEITGDHEDYNYRR